MSAPRQAEVHNITVRGEYEQVETDTHLLAQELSRPKDYNKLSNSFKEGLTYTRDIGRFIGVQRRAILEHFDSGTLSDVMDTHPELIVSPVNNLHERALEGDDDQPVGHNFFVNAYGFAKADLPWAKNLDDTLKHAIGAGLEHIINLPSNSQKLDVLTAISDTRNPETRELTIALAAHLAGRSKIGETFQEQQYGELLRNAKMAIYSTVQEVGVSTGLSAQAMNRAAQQIEQTSFGGFDHLVRLVTSDDTHTLGDYQTNSLRVEVMSNGSVQSAEAPSEHDARHTIIHEVHHASSAQAEGQLGLKAARSQGLEPNEGMTEYLAQLSDGSPDIIRLSNGDADIMPGTSYRFPVARMLALHEQFKRGENDHFATLFNAYYGEVSSPEKLERALDIFYRG